MTNSEALLDLAYHSLAHWGLKGNLRLIKERENSVYAFSDNHQQFALRVHRLGYHTNRSLTSEHRWIRALAKAGISVPQAVPTEQGNDFAVVSTDRLADDRQVDLMVWIEGHQLGSVESGMDTDGPDIRSVYQTMGRVAAQIHDQATQWEIPADFERHSWDLDGLLGSQPFWGRFWELAALTPQQKQRIVYVRERLRDDLSSFGQTSENFSLIHADFSPENFLVDGDKVQVIDFDDAGYGWHMFELATALYFIQDEPYYEVAKLALIEGYRTRRRLSDDDVAQLPSFMAARALTYLGWVHDRPDSATAQELTPTLIDLCNRTLDQYDQTT
ncbi:MAG: phosphotransferase enzyme family protein [Lysobacterales bacterium]